MDLLLMCWYFFKTGLFAVGGGMATIPFLYEMSAATGWFTYEQILNMLAVSESTPGPIGVNMATYAGYTSFGIPGGIAATLSLCLPSVIVILIIAGIIDKFRQNRFVNGAFYVLRPASTALITAAAFNIIIAVFFGVKKITFDMFDQLGVLLSNINWIAVALFAAMFLAMKTFKGHPIIYILIAAALGIVLKL